MATATISGTVTLPNSSGGANSSTIIGAPVITTDSTTGPTLTFTEKSSNTYSVDSGSPFTIPLGSIAASDILYIGTSQAATVVLNSGSFVLEAGGFLLIYMAGISVAPTIEPTSLAATVDIILAGA